MSGYAVGHVLRSSRFSGTALLVQIVIAEATHQDGTGAWPSTRSIAKLARTTDRSVRRVLRELERAGELIVERNAGPRGTNLYAIPGVGQIRLGEDTGVPLDTLSGGHRKRRPRTTGAPTPDNRDRTPDIAVSPEPSITVKDPSENRARAKRAPAIEIPTKLATQAQIDREIHAFGREAERVWTETAAKVGSPYTDRLALRIVHEQAIFATRWGTETQVLVAIRRRMDAKSSPRRIPEWVRLEAADTEAREHAARLEHDRVDEVIESPRAGDMRHLSVAATEFVAGIAP